MATVSWWVRRAAIAAACGLGVAGLTLPVAHAADLQTFVVDSTGDQTDLRLDGVCDAGGVCTLRAALQEASVASSAARVEFALPGSSVSTIAVGSALPVLSNPAGVTVDGFSQPGASPNTAAVGSNAVIKVEVRGVGAAGHYGFRLSGPNNVVRGLAIFDFKSSVVISGSAAQNNAVVGSHICTDAAGQFKSQFSNAGASGILINGGANRNSVGVSADHVTGTAVDPADRNVVSGCAHRGVLISFAGATFNRVQNNIIGLTPDGSAALPNRAHGVDVNYAAQDTLIGGYGPGEGNVISGNRQSGIEISHGNANRRNNVIGNFIGTDLSGTQAPAYAANGTASGKAALRLEGEKNCEPCAPNAGFSLVENNVIVGNVGGGMLIDKGQQRNVVRNNWIGVFPDGTPAGNAGYAIRIEQGAVNNTIGPNNTIAHNGAGIQMLATGSEPPSSYRLAPTGNTITGNVIYGHPKLGIDLEPLNQVNINGKGADDVQGKVQAPVIDGVADGTVTVTACPSCTVEVFLADGNEIEPGYTLANFGEGKAYLGSATAGPDGVAAVAVGAALPDDQIVLLSATSTDDVGNTSEFSRAFEFDPSVAPPPPPPAETVSTRLSVRVGSTSVAVGEAVVVSGELADRDTSEGLSGLPVKVFAVDPGDGSRELVETVLTDNQGRFSVEVVPSADSRFQADFGPQLPYYYFARSPVSPVVSVVDPATPPAETVSTRLSVGVGSTSVAVGEAVVVSGELADRDTSEGLSGLPVKVFAVDPGDGSRELVETVVTDNQGRFSVEVVPSADSRFQADFGPQLPYYYFARSSPSAVVTFGAQNG